MTKLAIWETQIANSPYLSLFGIYDRPEMEFYGYEKVSIQYTEGSRCFEVNLAGTEEEITLVFEGKEKLTNLIRNGKIKFEGSFRQRLKWEAILFLASQWEEMKQTFLVNKA